MRNSWTGCGETLQQSTALIMRQPIYLGDASHHCPATPYFAVSAPFSVSADQSEAVFDYNRMWQMGAGVLYALHAPGVRSDMGLDQSLGLYSNSASVAYFTSPTAAPS